MNKAKRLGVLALAGLVILSVLASTSIAYGAETQHGWSYDRGYSMMDGVREYMNYSTMRQSQNQGYRIFSPRNVTRQLPDTFGRNDRSEYGITDNVRDYMNQSAYGRQSQYKGYFVFPPRNATGYNVTEQSPENTFGWNDNRGYGMMDNVRYYMNNQASGNNMLNLDGWKIFGEN